MHADFLGDFLDHHRLQLVLPIVQKFRLPRDDRLAHAQNRVLPLLDILHQLNRRGEALFHVVAHFLVGGVARQQPPVRRAQAKLRHVVLVQENLPRIIYFAEVHIRLHQPRLRLVVTQPRARIEFLDGVDGVLHDVRRTVQRARNFLQLIRLHLLQIFGNDLLRQGVLRVERFQLQQQAFAQIAGADANRIKILHHRNRVLNVVL